MFAESVYIFPLETADIAAFNYFKYYFLGFELLSRGTRTAFYKGLNSNIKSERHSVMSLYVSITFAALV